MSDIIDFDIGQKLAVIPIKETTLDLIDDDCKGQIMNCIFDMKTIVRLASTCVFFQKLLTSIDFVSLPVEEQYTKDTVRPLISNLVDIIIYVLKTYNINNIRLASSYTPITVVFNKKGQNITFNNFPIENKNSIIEIIQKELNSVTKRKPDKINRENIFYMGLGLQLSIHSSSKTSSGDKDAYTTIPVYGNSANDINIKQLAAFQRIVTYLNKIINNNIYTKPWYIKMAEEEAEAEAEVKARAEARAKAEAEEEATIVARLITLENLLKVTKSYVSSSEVQTIMDKNKDDGQAATKEIVEKIIETTAAYDSLIMEAETIQQQIGSKNKYSSLDKLTFIELKAKAKAKLSKKKNPEITLSSLNTKTKMINFLRRRG